MTRDQADIAVQVAGVADAARRVRVFKVGAYPGRDRKRREVRPYVLADVSEAQALTEFRAAVGIQGRSDVVCMCAGDLVLELLDDRQRVLDLFLFAFPDELRWEAAEAPLVLADPASLVTWLRQWAPAAASTLPTEPPNIKDRHVSAFDAPLLPVPSRLPSTHPPGSGPASGPP